MANQKTTPRFSAQVRERAVRMMFEPRAEHTSQWAAIASIAARSAARQTFSNCVRQAQRDQGRRPGASTDERERIKALERENRELRQTNGILRKANEILRKASAYCAQAELAAACRRREAEEAHAPALVVIERRQASTVLAMPQLNDRNAVT